MSLMEEIMRFGVSMEKNLLTNFDELISRKGYTNRSEAFRDLVGVTRETKSITRYETCTINS
jgi:metal-responsive CopG/Arc/MetJ family transcriptional regulator